MKFLKNLFIIFVMIFIISCNKDHIHSYDENKKCDCGEILDINIKIINNDKEYSYKIDYGTSFGNINLSTDVEGYKFLGWYIGDELYDSNQIILSDVVITAKYEKLNNESINKEFIITFITGESEFTEVVKEGKKIAKPDDPVKEGYEFVGWFLGDIKYDFEEKVTDDFQLIARFELVQYVIKIVINDNETITSILYGEKVNKPDDPIIEGYKFIGWYCNDYVFDFNSVITEDTTIEAKFEEIKKYVVRFIDFDGSVLDTQIIYENDKAVPPVVSFRDNYDFSGWDKDYNNVNCDLDIYALYTVIRENFNIYYEIDSSYLYYNSKEEMALDFYNDFYDFINPDESRYVFIYGYNDLDAFWKNYVGGSLSNTNYLIYGNDIDANNDNYFLNSSKYKEKWYPLAKYVRDVICKSNKRFGYQDVEYKYGALDFVRYVINDPATYIATYGGEKAFYSLPDFEIELKSSYRYDQKVISLPNVSNPLFGGWYLDKDYLIGPFDKIDIEKYNDITLYGKINDTVYHTISFDTGCELTVDDIITPNKSEIVLPVLNRDGYTFVGWKLDLATYNDFFAFTQDVSLKFTAKWKEDGKINNIDLIYGDEIITYRNSIVNVEIPEVYVEKDTELRAAWVSDFIGGFKPSYDPVIMKEELNKVLDLLEYYNMNCVIFHVRTHNNSLYKSNLAPIKSAYGDYGTFEAWDYLPWFIDECHKRGIDFHAWLNPYRIKMSGLKSDATTLDVSKEYADYPKNPAHNPDNILMTYVSEEEQGAILNPAKKEVQDHIIEVIMELANNYDIDAIHFDDYFYSKMSKLNDVINEADQEDYIKYINDNPDCGFDETDKEDKKEWRRHNVNTLIYRIHLVLTDFNKKNNKSVEFGIAPSGVYKSGDGTVEGGSKTTSSGHYGATLYADTVKWVKEEWIDYIMPQCYTSFNNYSYPFQEITTWWNKVVEGTNVNLYIGIGLHKSTEDTNYSWVTEKYELNNQLLYLNTLNNVKGVSFFSSTIFRNIHENENLTPHSALIKLKNEFWIKRAKVPETKANKYE